MLVQVVIAAMMLAAVYALISAGLNLKFGVLNVLNLAHGEFIVIGMYAAFILHEWYGIDPVVTAFVAAPFFFLFGAVVYFLVVGPASKQAEEPHMAQIFGTFALAYFLQSALLLTFGADIHNVNVDWLSGGVSLAGISVGRASLMVFIAALLSIGGLIFFVRRTYWGKVIAAVGQDDVCAEASGINVDRVHWVVFAAGTCIVGGAGALIAPLYSAAPAEGAHFTLICFMVIIVGGLGRVEGAVLGGLVIALSETLGSYFVSPIAGPILSYMAFIAVLLWRPIGILGLRES